MFLLMLQDLLCTQFSMLGVPTGDGYLAMLTAVVEGLCLDPRPALISALSEAFTSQRLAVGSCTTINH